MNETLRLAATELRRLDKVEAELVEALKQIEMAAGATVCNVKWIEQHAAKALAKAEGGEL